MASFPMDCGNHGMIPNISKDIFHRLMGRLGMKSTIYWFNRCFTDEYDYKQKHEIKNNNVFLLITKTPIVAEIKRLVLFNTVSSQTPPKSANPLKRKVTTENSHSLQGAEPLWSKRLKGGVKRFINGPWSRHALP